MGFPTWFLVVWAIAAVLSLGYYGPRLAARRRRGRLFPPIGEVEVIYQETGASGRSLEDAITRFSGASRCLKLVVTPSELWTTFMFPFSLMPDVYDLEHRIPKADIVAVREQSALLRGKSLVVEFHRPDGGTAKLELWPKQPATFLAALQQGTAGLCVCRQE